MRPDVTFCLLEQHLPDGADHPFAETMLKHFEKLNTPLRCIKAYPDLHSQTQRFFAAGYEKVKARNLWLLWSDPEFLSPSQRLALDKVEPFDEWEEFALFASHYLLVTAQVGVEVHAQARRYSRTSSASDVSARTASPRRGENQLFGLTYVENIPVERGRAHHGAAFAIERGVAIAHHGGVGLQARVGSTDVYGPPTFKIPTAKLPSGKISPRSCHTITTLHNGDIILVGGRASPAAAMRDCWIQRGQNWERIQDLPSPRYRHSAVPVILPENVLGLVVFGGKEDQCKVHVDTLLWDSETGWRCLTTLVNEPTPSTRIPPLSRLIGLIDILIAFGADMLSLGPSHGFLFGGMRQDGMICHGFWRWCLGIVNEKVTGIAFTSATASLDVSIGIHPYMSRFGATASIIGGSVLVIGGIASPGVIPRKYEVLSITGDFLNSKSSVHDTVLSVTAVEPDRQRSWPRPLLVGHSSVTTIRGNVLVVGGGAVCFSFGNFWNSGTWLIHDGTTRPATVWALLDPEARPSSPQLVQISSPQSERNGSLKPIARSTLTTADDVRNIVHEAAPRVLGSVNIGPCLNLWTLDYLKEKIGTDREVIVHHSPSQSMNFHAKNFKYVKQPFGEFLDMAARGAHLYLRSISSEKPAEKPAVLAEDFPEIANDFRPPPEILLMLNNFHSSALRISSDVNMWLHYDVMANFYCQITGNRRLVIYPPSDITRLDFPPGSTTSRLGLFDTSSSSSQFDGIPGTNPIEAVLKPGDVLFIPPLWPHTGAPEGGVSIAVNVFFRNLSAKEYAAGRDVYGNRDLQPYEDGRRDLEKIVRRFDQDIPADIAQAYLNRLADELKARAARFVG